MRKLYFILLLSLALLAPTNITRAQVLLTEDFSSAAGTPLNGTNGWTAHSGSGTNAVTITSPGLIYAGYSGSGIGNAVSLINTGEDNNKLFSTAVTSGSVYAAALVNCSAAQASGDYFFHIGTGTSTFYAKVFIKSSGSGFAFGVSKNSNYNSAVLPVFTPQTYSFNTTYLIIVKYTYIAGNSNDQIDLYVFSAPTLPSAEPAATISTTDSGSGSSDASTLTAVYVRQGTSSVAPTVQVDGIKVGLTWSDIIPASAAPVASAATNVTSSGFRANWNNFTGSTGYYLDLSTASDFSSFIDGYNNKSVGNVTSLDIASLNPDTKYYYRIRSTDGTTTSANSNVIDVTTIVTAPTAKDASGVTSVSFNANWDAVSGAAGYRLDVSTASDFSTFVPGFENLSTGNVTTYSVTSLSGNQTYYYRVRGFNSNGTSGNSNVISVTTSAVATPAALSATNISFDGFTANWSFSSPVLGYFLDVSTSADFSTFVDGYNSKDVGTSTSFTVTSLNSSTTYYYRVHANTAGGLTPNSNTISAKTLLSAPVAAAASNFSATGFTANWNLSSGASSYWLDVSTSSDFSSVLPAYNNKYVGTGTTSHAVTGLNPGTIYYYRVSCANSEGSSPYSNVITVATNLVGVEDENSNIPSAYILMQNYPNPFNPTTVITYQLPESGNVTLKVYSVLGNEIAALVDGAKSAGTHQVRFDASNLPSGTYIYKIQAGKFSQIKKMMLVK